ISEDSDSSFDEASSSVRSKCVFTTHTPVDAGNDNFPPDLLASCFSEQFIADLKLTTDEFLSLGRIHPDNQEEFFGMTPFAIRMCRSSNGVAAKHGEVSRNLWLKMFPDLTD